MIDIDSTRLIAAIVYTYFYRNTCHCTPILQRIDAFVTHNNGFKVQPEIIFLCSISKISLRTAGCDEANKKGNHDSNEALLSHHKAEWIK